jgi:hypothetical protein
MISKSILYKKYFILSEIIGLHHAHGMAAISLNKS